MANGPVRTWIHTCTYVFGFLSLVAAQCDQDRHVTNERELQTVIDLAAGDCLSQGFTGDVEILNLALPPTESSNQTSILDLTSFRTVAGDLSIVQVHVTDGSGPWSADLASLNEVGGSLSFLNLDSYYPNVSSFSQLGQAGAIKFQEVTFSGPTPSNFWPNLFAVTSVNFTQTGVDRIGPFSHDLLVYDGTTQLTAYVTAVDNKQLTSIDFNGYGSLMTHVDIRGNSDSLTVDLPSTTVASMNLSNVRDITANKLEALGASESPAAVHMFSENDFEQLSLPTLNTVYGTLLVQNNEQLSSLSLGSLANAATLRIINNPALSNISISSLQSITGFIELDGPIDSINIPGLASAPGFSIRTSGSFDCSSLGNQLSATQSCQSGTPRGFPGGPGSNSPNPDDDDDDGGSSSGGSSGGLSQGAKIGIGVGVGVGGLAIIAAIIVFCCARRKRKQRISPRSAGANDYYMEPKGGMRGAERSPARYTKVHSGSVDHSSEERVSPASQPPSHFRDAPGGAGGRFREEGIGVGDDWSPPGQRVPNTDGRVELEEQQGMRHEMDARSLQDMDLEDDREETRSLEDIERAHGQR